LIGFSLATRTAKSPDGNGAERVSDNIGNELMIYIEQSGSKERQFYNRFCQMKLENDVSESSNLFNI
jgi:hypothetical protein